MRLVDARRLTGPNLLARIAARRRRARRSTPADVLEHARDGLPRRSSRACATALGLSADVELDRAPRIAGGAVIAYEAPIDVMLAVHRDERVGGARRRARSSRSRAPLPLEPKRTEIEAMLARDRSPRDARARRRGGAARTPVPLGRRRGQRRRGLALGVLAARTRCPTSPTSPGTTLGAIPIALVTGTNGKTTSSRLLARIAREAGLRVGASRRATRSSSAPRSSTTATGPGPAAARTVLRRTRRRLRRARDGARRHPPARPRDRRVRRRADHERERRSHRAATASTTSRR